MEDLRAIPWVLCWTQTRFLLHAWLGAGEAWIQGRDEPEVGDRMAEARDEDPLFRSYARLLSFTMAKTVPDLWVRYRRRLAPEVSARLVDALEESIRYRAPMIHPLNLLLIELLGKEEWSRPEERLFRETVTGIAVGMLTTG